MPNGWRGLAALGALAGAALLAAGCSSSLALEVTAAHGTIIAVGAESQYADVIQQVGGKYVQASAIMSNPNTDPHTFEASASTGRLVNAARLVVQNGLGYDTFMDTIEKAVPDSGRKTIVVQKLLQDVAIERSLFTQHTVKAFVYNQQVTDSLTESFISLARANHIPVVGVYETMPEPGYRYQSWMLAEVRALRNAVTSGVSSEHL
jgi:Zinc-uptake complex component A periplasmic